jgi:hypothetical protein
MKITSEQLMEYFERTKLFNNISPPNFIPRIVHIWTHEDIEYVRVSFNTCVLIDVVKLWLDMKFSVGLELWKVESDEHDSLEVTFYSRSCI